MKRVRMLLVMAISALTLAGCNTIDGIGKDLKKAGQAIEEAFQ